MQIKIIQWNIKINSNIDNIVKFLRSRVEDNTIINLQEVSSNAYEYIIQEIDCDANEPQVDAINDEETVFFDNNDKGAMARLLFGVNKSHDLKDTYKHYSILHSQPLEAGYTHITGSNKKRYDYIYCRNNWNVLSSKVSYFESINASSDHGLLETKVEIEDNG